MKAMKIWNGWQLRVLNKCLGRTEFHLLNLLFDRNLSEASDLLLQIHSQSNLSPVVLSTSLITSFSRIGRVNEARLLLDIMPLPNTVSYNAMLKGYLRSGMLTELFSLFEQMPQRDGVSFSLIISALLAAGRTTEALNVFARMPHRTVISWNAVISGLIRNSNLEIARNMFDQMPERNTASWNAMIGGYVEKGRIEEARELFERMGERNVISWTAVINGYCRIGDVEEAYRLFLNTPEKNVVCWTAMIGGLTWNKHYGCAFSVFKEMKTRSPVVPNEETLVVLAYACAGMRFLRFGLALHAYLLVNFFEEDEFDGRLSKGLLYMYTELGLMNYAYSVFCRRPLARSSRSYNCLINGFARTGCLEKARELFNEAPQTDKITWTCIINGHFIAGDVTEARRLFAEMPEKDSVAWGTMISGYIRNRKFAEGEEMFHEMRSKGLKVLSSTYVAMCCAAGEIGSVEKGRRLHSLIVISCSCDLIMNNALISMYEKCGEVGDAWEVFSKMDSRDVISWNTMIGGLAHHGLAEEALGVYSRMKESQIRPNSVTFLGLLCGCANAGLVERGCEVFGEMAREYSIAASLEHCAAMAQLLARGGREEEAEKFVLGLRFCTEPAIWGALLGACCPGESNGAVLKRVARRVRELDPMDAAARVTVCKMEGSFGRREEEFRLREKMVAQGIFKTSAFSWIQFCK